MWTTLQWEFAHGTQILATYIRCMQTPNKARTYYIRKKTHMSFKGQMFYRICCAYSSCVHDTAPHWVASAGSFIYLFVTLPHFLGKVSHAIWWDLFYSSTKWPADLLHGSSRQISLMIRSRMSTLWWIQTLSRPRRDWGDADRWSVLGGMLC